jgi:hypothetical protein
VSGWETDGVVFHEHTSVPDKDDPNFSFCTYCTARLDTPQPDEPKRTPVHTHEPPFGHL